MPLICEQSTCMVACTTLPCSFACSHMWLPCKPALVNNCGVVLCASTRLLAIVASLPCVSCRGFWAHWSDTCSYGSCKPNPLAFFLSGTFLFLELPTLNRDACQASLHPATPWNWAVAWSHGNSQVEYVEVQKLGARPCLELGAVCCSCAILFLLLSCLSQCVLLLSHPSA